MGAANGMGMTIYKNSYLASNESEIELKCKDLIHKELKAYSRK